MGRQSSDGKKGKRRQRPVGAGHRARLSVKSEGGGFDPWRVLSGASCPARPVQRVLPSASCPARWSHKNTSSPTASTIATTRTSILADRLGLFDNHQDAKSDATSDAGMALFWGQVTFLSIWRVVSRSYSSVFCDFFFSVSLRISFPISFPKSCSPEKQTKNGSGIVKIGNTRIELHICFTGVDCDILVTFS